MPARIARQDGRRRPRRPPNHPAPRREHSRKPDIRSSGVEADDNTAEHTTFEDKEENDAIEETCLDVSARCWHLLNQTVHHLSNLGIDANERDAFVALVNTVIDIEIQQDKVREISTQIGHDPEGWHFARLSAVRELQKAAEGLPPASW